MSSMVNWACWTFASSNNLTMKHTLLTQIHIAAPTSQVWQVLTDFEHYPSWNPFLSFLKGKVKVGERIRVMIQPPEGKTMEFKPTVLVFEKEKEFRWLGHLWLKGLFDGEHFFRLEANRDGTTTFIHGENFNGILVRFLKGMLDGQTKKGFEAMNKAIKERCEEK
jgi:hypothetical protein